MKRLFLAAVLLFQTQVAVALQPMPVTGAGTAGTPDTGVLTIQGSPTGTPIPITGSFSLTNPANGNTGASVPAQANYVGMNVGGVLTGATGTANGLKVDGSAVTQPVSAASLPLPTGAATAAKQPALGTAGTASTDVLTVQGITSMTPLKVDGSGVTQPISGTVTANAGTGTFAVSAASLPLPSGAATSANQTTGNGTLATISGQLPATLGAKATAASLAVNIASDQVVPISSAGRAKCLLFRNDYGTTPVTTGAYVQVVASTGCTVSRLYVFDSSGSAMKIAVGGSGSEVDQIYLPPGGSGTPYELNIPSGSRVAIEALDTNATAGQIIMTGLQ